jgi:hypothetical protein|tara:strand:- start:320 stop:538 length:219 start_codon:yes stop_codon:yes gene_type:complete
VKLFVNYLFFASLSSVLISCGGGSSNSNEVQVEINTQASTDSSSQNTQADTEKVIEEIPTFENAKFDEAIFN